MIKQGEIVDTTDVMELDDPNDQFNIGEAYYNTDGEEQDSVEAVKWFRLAANQGHILAQYYLATCYYHGDGVDKDKKLAVEWWQKAAE
ncbi:MAG: sel1 repeat family protein, partial [Victivallales bacterium]|nr:sel1 repeat family protein [Victivallales bacterium]